MEVKNDQVKQSMTYREALKQGIRDGLLKDDKVFLMGEDVGRYGGAYAVSKGLLKEFGEERIMDVPLSELGFVGTGIGAAIGGMRPIIEVMTINFSLLAIDQIVNNASSLLHMSGGQVNVPVVIRMTSGVGQQLGAQHSHSFEPFYAHVPGLIVLSAGTHEDARGMMAAALKSPDPVIIFEYISLLNKEVELSSEQEEIDIHSAKVRREGKDLTIVTYGECVYKCLEAARELAELEFDVEVIDLRVLNPIDYSVIKKSISKTHRALIVEEAWRSVSISSEIVSRIMENSFYDLDMPVERLCGVEVPIPYPKHLEEASIPQIKDITNLVKKMLG